MRKEKEEIDERNRTLMAEAERLKKNKERVICKWNKAGYTALGAPKHLYKRVNQKA